jgi:hypothetical protein
MAAGIKRAHSNVKTEVPADGGGCPVTTAASGVDGAAVLFATKSPPTEVALHRAVTLGKEKLTESVPPLIKL